VAGCIGWGPRAHPDDAPGRRDDRLAILGTIIADHAHATGTGAAARVALTSATADAYRVGAAVLLPIGIAALTLICSRSAAAEDDTAASLALQSGREALGSLGADFATNFNGIAEGRHLDRTDCLPDS
jgi:hypothetical protein